METLSKLFGSETKVKIIRLFLSNPERVFNAKEVTLRVKSTSAKVRRELSMLEKVGLIKPRPKGGKPGFIVDTQFAYFGPLQNFLIHTEPLQPKEIIKKLSKLGAMKLILVSGVFIQELESRIDLLIVGDGIKKGALENTIKTIESEIGRELRYTWFTTDDFKYRLSMFDKLLRDVLDYPHKKVLNRLGII